jgi:hypothetical protein
MNPSHFYVRPEGGYIGLYLRVPFNAHEFGLSEVLIHGTSGIHRFTILGNSLVIMDLAAGWQNCDSATRVARRITVAILAADTILTIPRPAVLQYDHVLNAQILSDLSGVQLRVAEENELYEATAA